MFVLMPNRSCAYNVWDRVRLISKDGRYSRGGRSTDSTSATWGRWSACRSNEPKPTGPTFIWKWDCFVKPSSTSWRILIIWTVIRAVRTWGTFWLLIYCWALTKLTCGLKVLWVFPFLSCHFLNFRDVEIIFIWWFLYHVCLLIFSMLMLWLGVFTWLECITLWNVEVGVWQCCLHFHVRIKDELVSDTPNYTCFKLSFNLVNAERSKNVLLINIVLVLFCL